METYKIEITTKEMQTMLQALRNYNIEICEWIIKANSVNTIKELKTYFEDTTKLINKLEIINDPPF